MARRVMCASVCIFVGTISLAIVNMHPGCELLMVASQCMHVFGPRQCLAHLSSWCACVCPRAMNAPSSSVWGVVKEKRVGGRGMLLYMP